MQDSYYGYFQTKQKILGTVMIVLNLSIFIFQLIFSSLMSKLMNSVNKNNNIFLIVSKKYTVNFINKFIYNKSIFRRKKNIDHLHRK